jgi:hypothetical protein
MCDSALFAGKVCGCAKATVIKVTLTVFGVKSVIAVCMPRWRHNYDAFASGSIIDDRGIATAVDSAGHLEA